MLDFYHLRCFWVALHVFTAYVQINNVGAGNPVLLEKLPVPALIKNNVSIYIPKILQQNDCTLCSHAHSSWQKQSPKSGPSFQLLAFLSLGWVVGTLYSDSPPSACCCFMPVSFTARNTCTMCSRFEMLWSHPVYILWTYEEESQVSLEGFLWAGIFGFCSFTESLSFVRKTPDSNQQLIVVHWSQSFESEGQLAVFDMHRRWKWLCFLSFYFKFWSCGMWNKKIVLGPWLDRLWRAMRKGRLK